MPSLLIPSIVLDYNYMWLVTYPRVDLCARLISIIRTGIGVSACRAPTEEVKLSVRIFGFCKRHETLKVWRMYGLLFLAIGQSV